MNPKQTTRASKFLSFVLRHHPEAAGIELDEAGWVAVDRLLVGLEEANRPLTLDELNHVVVTNPKKRFEFSHDGRKIRASQGHSIEIDLQYELTDPPEILYHGTATRFLDSIKAQGLKRMQRHHVHLSSETKTTLEVGARHGKPILLTIQSGSMFREGYEFFLSTNGVWLTHHVPPEFIETE